MVIINRPEELKRIKETKKWALVYGRRKTGKTFLIENFIKYGEYFFIKRDKGIVSHKDNATILYEEFLRILRRALEENKTIVVDEFHRLGDDFFDFLHHTKKQGKIILVSSTLFLSQKLLSGKSPLLGLFAEIPISLIEIKDCLKILREFRFDKKEILELSIILRDPISIDYFNEKIEARDILTEIIISSTKTIPALIGEIFIEEEREISAVYEGILRAIASGEVVSGKISHYLFSKKLIKRDDPSIIQQYLENLVLFGIIKKIQIYNKKRFIYKHISPLARIFYYSDERYNITERTLNHKEIRNIINEIMPRIVEDSVREMFAKKYGLKETIVEARDLEIDGCLLKFKKPEIALEVKWKRIKARDIVKAENNMEKIESKKKILFVPDKKGIKTKLDIMDVGDL